MKPTPTVMVIPGLGGGGESPKPLPHRISQCFHHSAVPCLLLGLVQINSPCPHCPTYFRMQKIYIERDISIYIYIYRSQIYRFHSTQNTKPGCLTSAATSNSRIQININNYCIYYTVQINNTNCIYIYIYITVRFNNLYKQEKTREWQCFSMSK